jgi:hypothetical protein
MEVMEWVVLAVESGESLDGGEGAYNAGGRLSPLSMTRQNVVWEENRPPKSRSRGRFRRVLST